MNFSLSRSTQFTIAGCVFLLFFLYAAWPGNFFFLNDDFIHVPLAGKGSLFNRSFIRPVSDITLYIDHLLWNKNAAGYHLTNILLHLLNTVLLFALARKLFQKFSPATGFDIRPWLAASIFLLNGCQTESVFWIIGRGGSLAGLFGMLSLIAYFNRWMVIAFISFIAGVFAYEAVLSLPLVISVFYLAERRSGERSSKGLTLVIGFWSVFLVYLVYRIMVNGALMNAYEQGALQGFDLVFLLYNFNALVARSFIPPFGSAVGLLITYVLVLLFIAAVVSGFIAKRKISQPSSSDPERSRRGRTEGTERSRSPVLAARALFLCVLVAVLPFVTLGADTHDSESGRFVYLSAIFACMLAAELVSLLAGRFKIATGIILVLIHACFFFSFSKDYQYAGQAVKQTLQCLQGAGAKAFVAEVPSQYKGALIFRSGLPEAVRWYNGQETAVTIMSLKEIEQAERLSCEKMRTPSAEQVDIIVIRVHP